jgi:flagellar motor switch protein FliN
MQITSSADIQESVTSVIRQSTVAASLSKVPVTLQVILGAAQLQLSDLMALKSGSDVRLDAKPGEPVTLMVNGCKIARGELYILEEEGDKFGVKITELFESALLA